MAKKDKRDLNDDGNVDAVEKSIARHSKTTPHEKPAEEPVVQQQQEQPSLNLQDLILVAQIIQICSSRGAFKADELANVGTLYTKLIAFLQSTGALTPAPEATQTEEK
jgi:hypothetical protein